MAVKHLCNSPKSMTKHEESAGVFKYILQALQIECKVGIARITPSLHSLLPLYFADIYLVGELIEAYLLFKNGIVLKDLTNVINGSCQLDSSLAAFLPLKVELPFLLGWSALHLIQ